MIFSSTRVVVCEWFNGQDGEEECRWNEGSCSECEDNDLKKEERMDDSSSFEGLKVKEEKLVVVERLLFSFDDSFSSSRFAGNMVLFEDLSELSLVDVNKREGTSFVKTWLFCGLVVK